MSEVATLYKNKYNLILKARLEFTYTREDDGHGFFHKLADHLSVDITKLPTLVLYDVKKDHMYLFENHITGENVYVQNH